MDWLAFSVPPGEGRDWRWLRKALREIFEFPESYWVGTDRRWLGYQHLVDLIHPGDGGERVNLGKVGYGGESQRGTMHVELFGLGCACIRDWSLVEAWGESVSARITRADVAHDDPEGKIVSVEKARRWLAEGGFNSNGRPPARGMWDDLGSGTGSTLYVGKRGHGKYCRVYEKGKEQGNPDSKWQRAEVEFRGQDQVIPWNIVTQPGLYLTGAYPCFAFLCEEQSRIKSIRRAAKINYIRMVNWLKTAGGKALNVMMLVEGDANVVVGMLQREGSPKRLERFTCFDGLLEESVREDDGSS